jgi:TPR repeat protein
MLESLLFSIIENLASKDCSLSAQDWQAIVCEALAGSAPAQYIVATAFEKSGDTLRADDWYLFSAKQGYYPAISKLRSIRGNSVA